MLYCVTADRPMDASKLGTFPNRVASRRSAKLSLASPASGMDKQSESNSTGPKKSRRVASRCTCAMWIGLYKVCRPK